MVSEPWKWISDFIAAGADSITIHIECGSLEKIEEVCRRIKEEGEGKVKKGVSLKPRTVVENCGVLELIERGLVDMVLVMSVEPGFGGQKFMEGVMKKVKVLRDKFGEKLDIQVDGGLNEETVKVAAEAGANVIVAGSAVFKAEDPGKVIRNLRKAVNVAAGGEK